MWCKAKSQGRGLTWNLVICKWIGILLCPLTWREFWGCPVELARTADLLFFPDYLSSCECQSEKGEEKERQIQTWKIWNKDNTCKLNRFQLTYSTVKTLSKSQIKWSPAHSVSAVEYWYYWSLVYCNFCIKLPLTKLLGCCFHFLSRNHIILVSLSFDPLEHPCYKDTLPVTLLKHP